MDSSKKISRHKKNRLPQSSRVCDEVVEYYEKHAGDRDIIKFMRLSSCSSGISNTTSSSSTSGLDGKSLRTLFDSEVQKYKAAKSNSLPNVTENNKKKEHIIPITMEPRTSKAEKENVQITEQNFKTPQKQTKTKETQTPESVTKSNKILEWDSLGDVGYIKSKSTSNISILERTILNDVLKELSISGHKLNANSSEGNLVNLNEDIKKDARSKSKSHEQNLNSPLASSTLLDTNKQRFSKGARPKLKDVSTATSYTNFEQKSVQTSITRKPELMTQEVQVNMSPGSDIVTTTTPSSFDYHSTHSSIAIIDESTKPKNGSSTTKSTEPNVKNDKELDLERRKERLTARLTEMIEINARNSENNNATTETSQNDSAKFEEVRNTLKHLLDENTEASSSSTSITHSPQLDLGIKLLCSLIEAKSLNQKQKKRLLRGIVNKIISMSSEGAVMEPYNPSGSSSLPVSKSTSQDAIMKSAQERLHLNEANKKISVTDPKLYTDYRRKSSGVGEVVIHAEVYEESSKTSLQDQKQTESSTKLSTEDTNKNQRIVQSKNSAPYKAAKRNKKLISDSDTVPATTTASNRTSKDITPQKETTNESDSNTMGEWLNPLTQSELEYEEKKRTTMPREKTKTKPNADFDSERQVQLNWINTEIERLAGLRFLLLNDETEALENADYTESASASKPSTDKLYDTVYTTATKSSLEKERVDGDESEEIDVIVEESKEDVLNKKTKVKFKRDRIRETQIIYDKATTQPRNGVKTQGKPLYRTVKETVTTRMQPLSTTQNKRTTDTYKLAPVQRSKIKTPSSSNEMENVNTYGQQRKQEFLDQYNRKKKSHYEALVQQQQEQEQQLNDQRRRLQHQRKYMQQQQEQQQPNAVANVQNANNYYSVPQPTERKYSKQSQRISQSNKPQRRNDDQIIPMQYNASSSTSLSYQQNSLAVHTSTSAVISSSDYSVPMGSNSTTSSTTTTHQYDAVARNQPMATIGVQTSNSLVGTNAPRSMRTQSNTGSTPCQIFIPCPPKLPCNCAYVQPLCCSKHMSCCRISPPLHLVSRKSTQANCAYQQPKITHSLGVQVKPKSIAYVITFDDSTEATSSAQHSSNVSEQSDEQPPQLTLQEYLHRAKPKFYEDSEQRKSILNEIQALRQERNRELREIVEDGSFSTIEKKLKRLPPPPTNQLRIFPSKEMKALTKKRFAKLPEVVKKQELEREQRYRRGNRLLRDIFNRRLQKRVRSGKISLNHSKTII